MLLAPELKRFSRPLLLDKRISCHKQLQGNKKKLYGRNFLLRNRIFRRDLSSTYQTHFKKCKVFATSLEGKKSIVGILENNEQKLEISFDDQSNPEATILQITGQDCSYLLEPLSGALRDQDLIILSANVTSTEAIFIVTDKNNKKLDHDYWNECTKKIHNYLDSVRVFSSSPLVYGIEDINQTKPIQPISKSFIADNVKYLRKTADEILKAADYLANLEQEIVNMIADGITEEKISDKEIERQKAAALLDRPILQLEAMLAMRRAPPEISAPEVEWSEGADLKFEAGGATSTGPASGTGFEILLQAFNWDSSKNHEWYKVIGNQAAEFSRAGFSSIWLPPPSDSVSSQGYLPRDLYNLNSCYGSEADLRECISKCHHNGIRVLADIVINHRCAQYQGPDGKWNKFGGRLPWDASAICSGQDEYGGTGGRKRGDVYAAAPNIDHSNPNIRSSIGFDGWRFDFVKGYPGETLKEYIDSTVPEMAVGEFWDTCEYTGNVLNYNQQNHRQRTIDWCDSTGGTSAAFDFTTKGILQEAVGRMEYWRLCDPEGRPPGMVGLWPSRAFLFIDNHDTGSTLQHWPFPTRSLEQGYCYILTHPGTPVVFYDHFWDGHLKNHIENLIKIRKKNKINCRSQIKIMKASDRIYGAVIDGKVAMKIGPDDWSPNNDDNLTHQMGKKNWKISTSGKDYAVWEY